MKLFKSLIIPLILIFGYVILLSSYPYFFSKINRYDSLGFLSLVEDKSVNIQKLNVQRIDSSSSYLLKGQKITAKVKASENNFGILLFRFAKLSTKVGDIVIFRIKKDGDNIWYYENTYKANQFQPDQYFTFGFPPIKESKNKAYVFEIESLEGTYKNGIGVSSIEPQIAFVYKYSIESLKNYEILAPFTYKKFIYVVENVNPLQNLQLLVTLIIFISLALFIMKKNRIKFSRISKIPLLITMVFFLIQAFISFNRFGILSVVEETIVDLNTDKQTVQLLEGQKISGTFKATENNLGILFAKLVKFGIGSDQVVFRIKRSGEDKWHHEGMFLGSQIENDKHFPLGFPPIADSKNSVYVFEIEALAGSYAHGIGVTSDQQGLLMYKFSAGDLTDPKTLFSFAFKKFIYVIKNVNYWQIVAVFILSALFTYIFKKRNIKLLNFVSLPNALRNKMRSGYKSLEKGSSGIFNRWSHRLTSTEIHLPFFDTNIKKRLTVGLLIFLLALTYRFSSTLVNQHQFFYAGLGGQGDYDQFIRAATCAVRTFCPAILGQNFLIETSVLGFFYNIFGFVGGIKAYLYLMIILSAAVATLPYMILSRKQLFTIGGVTGSLFLATSDYLTNMSLALPPDNGSLFLFSMFFIVYLLTLQYGTTRWLLFVGLVATIDGLNKLAFLINDLAALILFVPVFFIEKAKRLSRFPFFKLEPKLIFYSLLPLLIFFAIYSAWEYIVQIKFSTPYYLRALISGGSTFASSTIEGSRSLGESLSQGNILEKLYYFAGLTIVMIKRIVQNAGLNDIFLTSILFGLLFSTFRKSKFFIVKFISIAIFAGVTFAILQLFRNNFLGIQEVGQYVYAWDSNIYVNVFLFASIIFLFVMNFKYKAFKLALPILPYVAMIIILTKNAPWERMLAQIIVWSIILFSFLIDWILESSKKNYALKRLWVSLVFLVLFIFLYITPKTLTMVSNLYQGVKLEREEVKYLKWVNSSLPTNAIIVAGGKSDLVTVAQNIERPIVYNSLWSAALLIKPAKIPSVKPTDFSILDQLKISEIPGLSPSDFSIVEELKNKNNFKKNKYLILESDIALWRGRMAGIGDNLFSNSSETLLRSDQYSIKLYKFNSSLNKGIYELTLTSD